MLVLSRKVGEKLWIGPDVCIAITKITGGGVRIGIDAPKELRIVREELEDEPTRLEDLHQRFPYVELRPAAPVVVDSPVGDDAA